MSVFATLVSSNCSAIRKGVNVSHELVDNEIDHLKGRERISILTALGSLVCGVLTLSGVLGGGAILSGALFAIAGVAAFYSYCCREAESVLRAYQVEWLQDARQQKDLALRNHIPVHPVSA